MAIVVGTDFSEAARGAADAACALASRLGVRLELAHATEPGGRRLASGKATSVAEELEAQLAEEAARLRAQASGLTVVATLLEGAPDEALVHHAQAHGARLLVTAALGTRSSSRWRLGSVAERLAQSSPVPFLMVRAAAPFIAWAKGTRPLRVTVADDFSRYSEVALRWMSALREVGPIHLTVAHAYWPYSEFRRLGLRTESRADTAEAVLTEELEARLKGLGESSAEPRVVLSYGRMADPLVETAAQERADLLVLGTHQRRGVERLWQGSVSQTALVLAPMSVATIPLTETAQAAAGPIPALKRVLVTTDLSPLGNAAVAHAFSLLPSGGEVVLLHLVESGVPLSYAEGYGEQSTAPPGDEGELRAQLEAQLPRDAEAKGIRTRIELASAFDVPAAICQAAERHSADVVCMASRGRTGVARVVLGSVTQGVLARSRRPVLVVPGPAQER